MITTGDELQNADTSLEPGKIYDANGDLAVCEIKRDGL